MIITKFSIIKIMTGEEQYNLTKGNSHTNKQTNPNISKNRMEYQWNNEYRLK